MHLGLLLAGSSCSSRVTHACCQQLHCLATRGDSPWRHRASKTSPWEAWEKISRRPTIRDGRERGLGARLPVTSTPIGALVSCVVTPRSAVAGSTLARGAEPEPFSTPPSGGGCGTRPPERFCFRKLWALLTFLFGFLLAPNKNPRKNPSISGSLREFAPFWGGFSGSCYFLKKQFLILFFEKLQEPKNPPQK